MEKTLLNYGAASRPSQTTNRSRLGMAACVRPRVQRAVLRPSARLQRSFCIAKQITSAYLLSTLCLILFLKLLQIIKDALKA
jgi:hypothetical protein